MQSGKTVVWIALSILAGAAQAGSAESPAPPPVGAPPINAPPVTPPPEDFFEKVRREDRDAARGFYRKYLDVKGIPVVASGEVADLALERTRWIVSGMLAGRPDVAGAMVKDGMYLVIIGRDQVYTDMPEYRDHPDPAYQNERVRGTGGKPTSFGEENLLSLCLDRYDDESIAVHEFCHTIDGALRALDPTWGDRLRAAFRSAREAGLYENAYAGTTPGEYWAEIAQAYFDSNRVNNWNHGPIGTREQLKAYDPDGYELVRSTFNLGPGQEFRYSFLQELPRVEAPPSRLKIDPYYLKFTWAREFVVVGRRASDEALLRANDTIRKMFAYRHDILKALIGAGAKLVVLGPDERVFDLPEYKSLKDARGIDAPGIDAPGIDPAGIDALARTLDYTPELGLLVVAEENVMANPADAKVGSNQVIRAFARSICALAAGRPVDPDWEKRGRAVQQYELRVQRLDVRFDERLKELYGQARNAGRWKGTGAVHDRVAYWAEGVLAYFDALGQDAAPDDAAHPIATREALRDYDPGLHALVEETMAYRGKVDWRYRPGPQR